jgi:hypothetical protein
MNGAPTEEPNQEWLPGAGRWWRFTPMHGACLPTVRTDRINGIYQLETVSD